MKDKSIGEYLLEYLGINRGIGHTEAAIIGLQNNPEAIMLVANYKQAKRLSNEHFIDINQFHIIGRPLEGVHKPVVIDGFALDIIIQELIDKYKTKIYELEEDKRKLHSLLNKSEKENEKSHKRLRKIWDISSQKDSSDDPE
jgi:hypothetical protein